MTLSPRGVAFLGQSVGTVVDPTKGTSEDVSSYHVPQTSSCHVHPASASLDVCCLKGMLHCYTATGISKFTVQSGRGWPLARTNLAGVLPGSGISLSGLNHYFILHSSPFVSLNKGDGEIAPWRKCL